MQVIAVINFKVGSGKTTTAAHLAQKLALYGYRVLGIDLDAQASLSTLHGFQPEFDLLDGGTLNDAIRYDDPVPLRRVDTDPEGIEALKVSLSEYGQQVPVLLRHSAT